MLTLVTRILSSSDCLNWEFWFTICEVTWHLTQLFKDKLKVILVLQNPWHYKAHRTLVLSYLEEEKYLLKGIRDFCIYLSIGFEEHPLIASGPSKEMQRTSIFNNDDCGDSMSPVLSPCLSLSILFFQLASDWTLIDESAPAVTSVAVFSSYTLRQIPRPLYTMYKMANYDDKETERLGLFITTYANSRQNLKHCL